MTPRANVLVIILISLMSLGGYMAALYVGWRELAVINGMFFAFHSGRAIISLPDLMPAGNKKS